MALSFEKRKLSELKNAEDADTGASGSLTAPTGTNSGGSSSFATESNDGAVSSSSTAPTGNNYEVFLSFRGPDTRNGFADHLYRGLIDAGIHAFRDDEELRQGEKIGPDLLAAIKNSKILIPILSENYGFSKWCLDELIQIMECKNSNTGHIVLPIFYKVAPGDVRRQIGKFGEAFRERERCSLARGFDPTILKKWKQALEEVGDLRGREANGPEGELVQSVVREVLSELIAKFELDIPENLIGIDSQVERVMKFIANNSHTTLFVGIHGMGGIGKTTLAKTIYNQLLNQFEGHSFIDDIREKYKNGVEHLQNKLIRDILKKGNLVCNRDEGIRFMSSKFKGKKVLILLDDVDADVHLEDLAGNHDWFSSGSVIIITTRNESILDKVQVDCKHDHEVLDKDSSLILFSRHAFRNDAPPSEFVKLTDEVVSTTGRLPLSLKILGSFLGDKPRGIWEDTIKQLRNVPHEDVRETLKISYDTLEDEQRQIFLDIACFFIGTDLKIASYMWDACDFYPKKGIEILRLRSLIKVGEKHELRMHDQLRDFGREIIRQEDKREPRNRSRLWDLKEIIEVLEEDEGTTKIEAIYLPKDRTTDQVDDILTGKKFKKLRNLRFLNATGAYFSGDFKNSMKKLKWLQWGICPSTFEADNFHVEELRVLDLSESDISDRWRGWSFITMAKKLKYLNLTSCLYLEKTSFLSAFENLEVLILANCWEMEQIDSSIGNMKSLVCLDLSQCENLKGLPTEVGKLEALEQLNLRECRQLSSLPDGIWALQNLQVLDISRTGIKKLPDSIGALQNLEKLNISFTGIKELPNGIGRLRKLRELDASYCRELGGETSESIRDLSSLQCLDFFSCTKLQSLSVLPSSLTYLTVTCQSRKLPSLSNLTHLKELRLYKCKSLECIGEHPSTPLEKSLITPYKLEFLEINFCNLETLDVSLSTHMRTLSVTNCANLLKIRGLDKLKYLESLSIAACFSIERLDLPKAKGVKKLMAPSCKNLVEIQGLDRLESLEEICIIGCASIQRLDLSNSRYLLKLNTCGCKNLVEIQGLDRLKFLDMIAISECTSLARLDLSKSRYLTSLYASDCKNLVEIQGLDSLEALKEINICGCTSLARLDLSKSKVLCGLYADNCKKLVEIQGLDRLESLEDIRISGCASIQRLDLSKSKGLKKLFVKSCENLFEIQGLDGLEFLQVYEFGEDNSDESEC